jgi:hypothetical protein
LISDTVRYGVRKKPLKLAGENDIKTVYNLHSYWTIEIINTTLEGASRVKFGSAVLGAN